MENKIKNYIIDKAIRCKKGQDIALERYDFDNWVRMHIDDIVTETKTYHTYEGVPYEREVTYFVENGEKEEIAPYEDVRIYEN